MNKERSLQAQSDNLWVLTKLKDCTYALEGSYVEAIFMLETEITTSGNSDEINLGIIPYRDTIIPVIDLRKFLGMDSYAQEQEEFAQMLEQRKQDHIRWVDELKRCLEENDKFKLATDPHKCAFGKWYDNFETDNNTVSFHLKKIDEPHKKLHATAHEAFACKRECPKCTRGECLQTALSKAVDVYMPTVVNLLEEAKQVFQDSYRKMVVVVSKNDHKYGLLVDEVISVEPLSIILPNTQLGISDEDQMVPLVGHRKADIDLILMLDIDKLYERYEQVV